MKSDGAAPRVGRSGRAPSLGARDPRGRIDAQRALSTNELGDDMELGEDSRMRLRVSGAVRRAQDGSITLRKSASVGSIPNNKAEDVPTITKTLNELIAAMRAAGLMEDR